MNLYQVSIISFLDFLAYLIISSKLIGDRIIVSERKNLISLLVLMMAFSLIMGVAGVTVIEKYSFIVGIILSVMLLYSVYKKGLKETLYTYLISTIIILIVQFLVMSMLLALRIDISFEFEEGLLAYVLILPILILINKFAPLNLLFKFVQDKNRIFTTLILNMFIVVIAILIYRYIEMEQFLRNVLIIPILSIGLLFVNLVIIRDGLRNEYEEKMLNVYEKYLPIIDDLMKELRARQHEFDNHIQAINMISVTDKDPESIKGSMKRYVKDLDKNNDLNKLIKLNDKILAGFLYNKSIKAKEYCIDFQIEIKDYGFKTNLKDYELIEVLGNLIDNAFDSGVTNNRVILEINKEGNMGIIEVKNKHPYLSNGMISKIFTPGYSTKNLDNHGYGLTNITKILKRNNGQISVENKIIDGNNYVVFRVSFARI